AGCAEPLQLVDEDARPLAQLVGATRLDPCEVGQALEYEPERHRVVAGPDAEQRSQVHGQAPQYLLSAEANDPALADERHGEERRQKGVVGVVAAVAAALHVGLCPPEAVSDRVVSGHDRLPGAGSVAGPPGRTGGRTYTQIDVRCVRNPGHWGRLCHGP